MLRHVSLKVEYVEMEKLLQQFIVLYLPILYIYIYISRFFPHTPKFGLRSVFIILILSISLFRHKQLLPFFFELLNIFTVMYQKGIVVMYARGKLLLWLCILCPI